MSQKKATKNKKYEKEPMNGMKGTHNFSYARLVIFRSHFSFARTAHDLRSYKLNVVLNDFVGF